MKKIVAVTAGVMLGASVFLPLADVPVAYAKEQNVIAVEDDSEIFKVAEFRPERELEEYRLTKYDVINLMVIGHPNGIGVDDVQVGVDGLARLPYAGTVKLIGLTLDEARDLIVEKMSRYIKIPEMNIHIKSYGPRKVYVMGNVNSPGEKNIGVDSMNVYAALANAGGVDKKGRSKHVHILRQLNGVIYDKEVNMDAFVKQHDMSQNIALEDGDIVYVPDSGKIIFKEDVAPYINVWATYRSIVK